MAGSRPRWRFAGASGSPGTVLLDAVGIDVEGIELTDFFSLTPQELIAHGRQ